MSLSFSADLRTARAQAIVTRLGSGTDTVTIKAMMHFYTGPRPVSGAAITTEVLVGSTELSEPAGTVTDGILTFDLISDELSANVDDDIFWCRVVDSDDVFIMDMDCGIIGSGKEIIFNTLTARIGGVIKVLSGSFTEGNV